jgi:molecular chaperone DnaJ
MNIVTCTACNGKGITGDNCDTCNGFGSVESENDINFKVPPGVITGNILRLSGCGNYVNQGGRDLFSNLLVTISVTPDKEMKLIANNVHSKCKISLLEALQGTLKNVRTVKGDIEVKVPGLTKNKDNSILNGYGVQRYPIGNHIIEFEVEYPDKVDDIIKVLKKKAN